MKQALPSPQNRRQFERLALRPMYTGIIVRAIGRARGNKRLTGHAYDISEGGVQFEVDTRIEPGAQVELTLELPGAFGSSSLQTTEIRATGNVVWVDDAEPGPVRMAAVFSCFEHAGDHELLLTRMAQVKRSSLAA